MAVKNFDKAATGAFAAGADNRRQRLEAGFVQLADESKITLQTPHSTTHLLCYLKRRSGLAGPTVSHTARAQRKSRRTDTGLACDASRCLFGRPSNLLSYLKNMNGMETTRLSSKGQIILPKSIRDTHRWQPGVEFMVEDTPAGVLLRSAKPLPPTRIEDVAGCLRYTGKSKTLAQIDAAIKIEVKARRARGRYYRRSPFFDG